jgi:hypothetical protein
MGAIERWMVLREVDGDTKRGMARELDPITAAEVRKAIILARASRFGCKGEGLALKTKVDL